MNLKLACFGDPGSYDYEKCKQKECRDIADCSIRVEMGRCIGQVKLREYLANTPAPWFSFQPEALG